MAIISAKLISWNKIEIVSSNDEIEKFDLFIDLESVFYNFVDSKTIVFSYEKEVLGHLFSIRTSEDAHYVDVTDAVNFEDFDEKYSYLEDDLGPNYYKDFTKFVLWAPLASKVELRINDKLIEMNRGEKGTYYLNLDGDYDGALYDYIVYINGEKIVTCDPYAKSSNLNSEKSAVIDLNKVKRDMFDENLPPFNEYVEAIIYETSVRDISSSDSSNIKNKGKFLGLCEKGTITSKGNPTGIDYLSSLGISHLQLLPVLDFASVKDDDPSQYNWGYDPLHFFALEGSYSTNPNDPYSRMNEFIRLVQTLHRSGIRVNLDVVYNHVYKKEIFALHKITPNYFFRKEGEKYANHSGCGNDFYSERPMARKIILDSLKFLTKTYDVDGFRFDLMGLIDLETMKIVEKELHELKPSLMLYGEGWSMGANSPYTNEYATLDNANKLNGIAFFNDKYRNIVRGAGDKAELYEKGYLLGNQEKLEAFKYIYACGTYESVYPIMFKSYNQSLNYVECHDNATLFDAISETLLNTSEDDLFKFIKLFNKVLLLSPGIVFIHAGQEFGQSKFGQANTYNLGDRYNALDYDLRDSRMSLVNSFINYVKTRKLIPLFKISDPEYLNPLIEYLDVGDVLDITLKSNSTYHLVINVNDKARTLNDDIYNSYHLFGPFSLRKDIEKIVLKELGMASHKASIFKVT